MQVANIGYISHLLSQKNSMLKIRSMTEFARSKRRLMSMESQYCINNLIDPDSFTRSNNQNK